LVFDRGRAGDLPAQLAAGSPLGYPRAVQSPTPAPIVAIDGPAGAGKSTVARQLARRLGLSIIDTGAIYRSVALAARRAGVAWDDDEGLRRLLETPPGLGLHFLPVSDADGGQRVLLRGHDVTEAIRTPEISRGSSVVSARPVVRERLLDLQRALGRAAPRGAVLEGRDIGTVVFPDAAVKFFLTASDEARARRRFAELGEKGLSVSFAEVLADQRRRDRDDTERAIAPLKAAPDAMVIDTTGLDLNEVVARCTELASARLAGLAAPAASP
jgi:cytidylate kinase